MNFLDHEHICEHQWWQMSWLHMCHSRFPAPTAMMSHCSFGRTMRRCGQQLPRWQEAFSSFWQHPHQLNGSSHALMQCCHTNTIAWAMRGWESNADWLLVFILWWNVKNENKGTREQLHIQNLLQYWMEELRRSNNLKERKWEGSAQRKGFHLVNK